MLDKIFESLKNVDLTESRKTAYDKYVKSGNMSEEVFNKLISLDKTPTKKYIDWACEQFTKEKGDENEIMDLANKYDDAVKRKRVEAKDINQISFEDVKKAVETAPESKTVQKKANVVEGSEVVLDDKNVTVYLVKTEQASKILGKGTKWCTSAEESCAFNTYDKDKLQTGYMVISKTKKDGDRQLKFMVWVEPNGNKQAWAANDEKIDWAEMKSQLGIGDAE